jgi:predicted AAA+ superfamily ATPase
MLVDHFPEKKVLITGSSSIELFSKLGEPLTGRQTISLLYPISVMELYTQYGPIEVDRKLSDLLVFGSYPEVLAYDNPESKSTYLASLRDAYLLHDLYDLASIRHSSSLLDLLRLLAYQIGNEVSLNELGKQLGLSKQSVERYLYLLEKAFVIKKVNGFSRNLRSEVTKTARYYFWDVGIRNSIINNYNQLAFRNDIGMLWENFLFIERVKKQEYQKLLCNNYFWRTYQQQEVDMVEERDGRLYGFEFKWNNKAVKAPKAWLETYPEATFKSINRENYFDFVL